MRWSGQTAVASVRTDDYQRGGRARKRVLFALGLISIMALAAVAGPAGFVGTASAANDVNSCQTITAAGEYDLTVDISQSGTCFEVASDDVVIDGQGHAIDLQGGGVAVSLPSTGTQDNVTVSDLSVENGGEPITAREATNLTVRNLDVRASSYGVRLYDTRDVTLDGVEVRDTTGSSNSSPGLSIENGTDVALRGSLLSGNDADGLDVTGSSEVTVDGLDAIDNGGLGVSVTDSADVTVTNADLARNDGGVRVSGGSGIDVRSTSVDDSDGLGVDLAATAGVTIEDVRVTGGYGGLDTDESSVTVSGLTVNNSNGWGVFALDGSVVVEDTYVGYSTTGISAASRGMITRNVTVEYNGNDGLGVSRSNQVHTNVTAIGNGQSGIQASVNGNLDNSVVKGADTYVRGNEGYGVDVLGGAGTVELDLQDATVRNNGEGELMAHRSNVLRASNVDVGDSAAANTTVDVELQQAALSSVSQPPAPPSGQASIGRYLDLEPVALPTNVAAGGSGGGQQSTSYADVTLHYTDQDVAGIDETNLSLWHYDGTWSEVSGTIDRGANTVSTNVTSFGVFAPLADAPPQQTPTPMPTATPTPTPQAGGGGSGTGGSGGSSSGDADIGVADVTIDDDGAQPGDSVPITVELQNAGDAGGTEEIVLEIGGEEADSRNVFVPAGGDRTIDFAPTFDEAGEFAVTVQGGNVGSVTVASQDTDTSEPTDPPTETATATDTPTEDDGGAPTPDGDDGGLGLVGGLAVALLALIVIGGLAYAATRE